MKSPIAIIGTVLLLALVAGFSTARQNSAAVAPVEIAALTSANWDRFASSGKEADAIYGDIVLRNGHLSAVIAQPLVTRHANMTVKDVAGAVIDLSVANAPNDQLSAFYPGKKAFPYRSISAKDAAGNEIPLTSSQALQKAISVSVKADGTEDRPEAIVTYELGPADRFLTVTTKFTNRSQADQTVSLEDDLLVDGRKEDMVRTADGTSDRFWLYDRYWGQAYGLDCEGCKLQLTSDQRIHAIKYITNEDVSKVKLEPGKSYQLKRRLYPGANTIDVNSIAANLNASNSSTIQMAVVNKQGRPIPRALVEFKRGQTVYGSARTDNDGSITAVLPNDQWTADVFALGNQIGTNVVVASDKRPALLSVDFDPGTIVATITDSNGQAIACKTEFTPQGDNAKLNFGPETAEFAVKNLVYSANGKFNQSMPPGKYAVTISHGPEFDAVFTELTIPPGQSVPLNAKLLRSVETPGWISTDFHSHSSPSGDNSASQLGRVLNLVAEHIEFAPCTEHNRVTTYQPHIDRLQIANQLASVPGIELTGIPLPLNHQNAFPMKWTPGAQDGGGPISGPDLETQIERLALHDDRSEKLIQVNHPDLGWMFYDKNGDGQRDSGHERAFPFMDVVEIHPIDLALRLGPTWEIDGKTFHNTVFNWLQLLNQGFRIYGVVNTDAHYNYHGSGSLRNWIQSSTDDPAKIDPMEMVKAAERGRLIMSNGPYLEVYATETGQSSRYVAGQDLKAASGRITLKVRVQCPNWLDVNRLFVLVNGRVHSKHDYSREKTPDAFRGGNVKFDRTLDLELKDDAHIVVVTGNTETTLSSIYGPTFGKARPAAVTNPIFVDVNGDGFQPNKDTLDHPLPTKNQGSK